MSWTTPFTAVAGTIYTAAQHNTYSRDDLLYLYGNQGIFDNAARFNNVITPTLSASQNNWNPTGLSTANRIRLNPSVGTLDLTGLTAQADGTAIFLYNVNTGANVVVIKTESGSSTSTNRFTNPGAADVPMNPKDSALALYDTTNARWQMFYGVT